MRNLSHQSLSLKYNDDLQSNTASTFDHVSAAAFLCFPASSSIPSHFPCFTTLEPLSKVFPPLRATSPSRATSVHHAQRGNCFSAPGYCMELSRGPAAGWEKIMRGQLATCQRQQSLDSGIRAVPLRGAPDPRPHAGRRSSCRGSRESFPQTDQVVNPAGTTLEHVGQTLVLLATPDKVTEIGATQGVVCGCERDLEGGEVVAALSVASVEERKGCGESVGFTSGRCPAVSRERSLDLTTPSR